MKYRVFTALLLIALMSILFAPSAQAAPPGDSGGPEVSSAIQNDVSKLLTQMTASSTSSTAKHAKPQHPLVLPSGPVGPDPALQKSAGSLASATSGVGFAGVGN